MKNLDMKLDSATVVSFAKKWLKELIRIGKARVLLPCATCLLILPIHHGCKTGYTYYRSRD